MAGEISVWKRRVIVEFEPGGGQTVRALCRRLGVSERSFYRLRAAFRSRGSQALVPASRAPRVPRRVWDDQMRQRVTDLWHELDDQGLDKGARTIAFHLQVRGVSPHPSVSTIHRMLTRAGLTEPSRAKRPRSSYTRFARTRANELWQLDAISWTLPDTGTITVYQVIDDATRVCVALHAAPGAERAAQAITTLDAAMAAYGRPQAVLSDNGAAFNTHRLGRLSSTELHLAALGVWPVSGRVGHPTTQGKVERSHQGLRKWLDHHPHTTLTDLRTTLEDYRRYYNQHRPHQAHHPLCTPDQAWQATTVADPPHEPIDPDQLLDHPHHSLRHVRSRGVLSYKGHTLYLGLDLATHPIRITHLPDKTITLTDTTNNHLITHLPWPPPTPYTNLTNHRQKS